MARLIIGHRLLLRKLITTNYKLVLLRIGSLSATCNKICNLAARDMRDFWEIRSEFQKLALKLENRMNGSNQSNTTTNVIKDPAVVKTKGAPHKRKWLEK